MINLLFTSVGRRVELTRLIQSAYDALELAGHLVVADIDPRAPAMQAADHAVLVPRISAVEYVPTLVELCRAEGVNVIFPLIDPEITILAAHRETLEATGARLAIVGVDAANITGDKWLTAEFFRNQQLSTPASWLPHEVRLDQMEYPVFIKPRRGSAAEHTFKVRNTRELAFFMDYVPDPIIQEFLPGPEITNDVICDLDGSVLTVVSRQRLEVRSGEVAKGVTVYDPAITAACVKIAEALPAIGPITVQCMLKDGVPHFTEINARLGGGAPLGIAAGADWPRWLLARIAGIPVEIPPLGSYRTGVYMTRFDDSFFLTEADLARLESRRL